MRATELPTTLQGFFDNAWQHAIVEKNPQSTGEDGFCKYRSEDGNACLIGCSIPDTMYDPKMEYRNAMRLVFPSIEDSGDTVFLEEVKPIVRELRDLQLCHDALRTDRYRDDIEYTLRSFASENHLTIPGEQSA